MLRRRAYGPHQLLFAYVEAGSVVVKQHKGGISGIGGDTARNKQIGLHPLLPHGVVFYKEAVIAITAFALEKAHRRLHSGPEPER